jgi:hypothetical protein
MPIEQITPMSAIDNHLKKGVDNIEKQIVYNLSYIGERCINEARSANSYIDRTGNLRSSIGYVIVRDGKIIQMSDFSIVKSGNDGSKKGAAFAREIARGCTQGIVLIVVAGENYAKYVSARGYNVLDSSELLAEKLVPSIMKTLGFSLK